MPRLQAPAVAAAEVVVEAGRFMDSSPFLTLDPPDELGIRGSRRVFAVAEPVEASDEAARLAPDLLERLRDELDRRETQATAAALVAAIQAVNVWLCEVNLDRPPSRRLLFGLTCVASRDDELIIAQVPPSQILIGQEGEVYAFPELDDPEGAGDGGPVEPLGTATDLEPELYQTRIERGDLIVLCSSSIAEAARRERRDVFASGDAQLAAMHLEDLVTAYHVRDGYAAAVEVAGRASRRGQLPEAGFLRRVGELATHLLPEETAARFQTRTRRRRLPADQGDLDAGRRSWAADEVDLDVEAMHTESHSGDLSEIDFDTEVMREPGDGLVARGYEPPLLHAIPDDVLTEDSYADTEYWSPEEPVDLDEGDDLVVGRAGGRGKLSGLLAAAVLALSAAVVGVWQITVHRDHSLDEPRDDGTLGLPRLHRYEDSPQFPDLSSVRARLPRAPISPFTGMVALVLVAVLVAGFAYSIHGHQAQARQARIESLLQQAVHDQQQASQQTSPVVAQAFLLAAQARLRDAQSAGLDATRATQEANAITQTRDKALKIDLLNNVDVLGTIPPAPQGVTPRLFMGNGQLYVLTDALYRLEANGNTLVRLLASGDVVGGKPVGTLLGAAWGNGSPIAFDATSAYVFDPTAASWTREPLGTFGTGYSDITAANGFEGNLYMLSPSTGQILKFRSGAFSAQPEDWTGGLASSDLRGAADMQIDGHIFVLLKDGRILDFYMAALSATLNPAVTPPISNAVALSEQPNRPYFYVADGNNRILRLSRNGTLVQQFMSAPGQPSLSGIRDLTVDDVLGTGYVLTNNELIEVRLPPPPH